MALYACLHYSTTDDPASAKRCVTLLSHGYSQQARRNLPGNAQASQGIDMPDGLSHDSSHGRHLP